nr:2'-5' RNA ligase family protein [Propionicimonas sp.]
MMAAVALAVCYLFDQPGDRLVRQLWARLEAQGVRTLLTHTHRRHRPHLSLAVAREWELSPVLEALAGLPAGEGFETQLPGMLAFTRGRVSLAAGVSADLARRQQAVVTALEATGADLHHHYRPGRWVPHVSLATGGSAGKLPVISGTVNDALPLVLHVVSAAVIDSSTGQSWPLAALP